MDSFWTRIAQDIEENYKNGHPKDWKEEGIKSFLADVEDKLIAICSKDIELAERCGIPFIKGRYAVEHLKTITPSTFRRIFQYQTSKGKTTTKHQFAIYFGGSSFEHYMNMNSLKNRTKKVKTEVKFKTSVSIGIGLFFLMGLIFQWAFSNMNNELTSPSNTISTSGKNSPVIISKEKVNLNYFEHKEDSINVAAPKNK